MLSFGEAVFDSDDDENDEAYEDLPSDGSSDDDGGGMGEIERGLPEGIVEESLARWRLEEASATDRHVAAIVASGLMVGSVAEMAEFQQRVPKSKQKKNQKMDDLLNYISVSTGREAISNREDACHKPELPISSPEKRTLLQEAVQHALKQTEADVLIKRTVMFAGQSVTIEEMHRADSEKLKRLRKKERQKIGHSSSAAVDQVVDDIRGESVINTVAKTVHDWEAYKRQAEPEPEGRRKDSSFLSREAFKQNASLTSAAIADARKRRRVVPKP